MPPGRRVPFRRSRARRTSGQPNWIVQDQALLRLHAHGAINAAFDACPHEAPRTRVGTVRRPDLRSGGCP